MLRKKQKKPVQSYESKYQFQVDSALNLNCSKLGNEIVFTWMDS